MKFFRRGFLDDFPFPELQVAVSDFIKGSVVHWGCCFEARQS